MSNGVFLSPKSLIELIKRKQYCTGELKDYIMRKNDILLSLQGFINLDSESREIYQLSNSIAWLTFCLKELGFQFDSNIINIEGKDNIKSYSGHINKILLDYLLFIKI